MAKAAASYRFGNGAGEAFETRNPAHPDQVVGIYASSTREDVERTLEGAAIAQRSWRAKPQAERNAILSGFLDTLERRTDDIATAITLEQGKPTAEARAEAGKSIGEARTMLSHALAVGSSQAAAARPGFRNIVSRRPRGVIAAISPWNFPILTPMRKVAPALAFGNAIVLKPSEYTPATAAIIEECARESLPANLLSLVFGGGAVGDQLVRDRRVRGITFTGSVSTGRKIYAAGAENLVELSLELGGKNAAVINDVTDLDAAVDQIAGAAFQCAGQRCTAISRILVHTRLRDAVTEAVRQRAERQVLGDGFAAGVTMGPLSHAAQLEKVASMVAQGKADGARIVTGGDKVRPASAPEGYFYAPTVLADVQPGSAAALEEIFGPVISILSYETEDQAFEILNSVGYGLTAALFSNQLGMVERFVAQCETGMLHVNHGTIPDNHMPFGGIKDSGVGAYSVGPSSAAFYTTEHSVYVKA
ncbi:aldehyde dehydrogenase family protein [Devosia nitrariae]|uniref:Aldehyde dehydrogenase n=1 Tax=Devosia nitrariae TaxID=2071872 RepID=A0ABQ5W6W4_9HYPH|nr:aldehyde dehydrogenase family protein [Devosia nitrariae]GLQ55820.1 aldehyde dehydrogenase [Devosia nitrariae]